MTDLTGNPAGHNHLNHDGAIELARRLRAYWLDRGYNIETLMKAVTLGERAAFSVRSNLVSGLPPAGAKVLVMDEAT